eukprot:s962_g2.t1
MPVLDIVAGSVSFQSIPAPDNCRTVAGLRSEIGDKLGFGGAQALIGLLAEYQYKTIQPTLLLQPIRIEATQATTTSKPCRYFLSQLHLDDEVVEMTADEERPGCTPPRPWIIFLAEKDGLPLSESTPLPVAPKKVPATQTEDPEKFWGDMAREFFWKKPFEKVGPVYNFDRSKGDVSIRWFEGGTTNISYNCLDRNIEKGFGSKTAIYYECNDLEDAHAAYSYSDVLKMDRLSVYLPMILELPASMLACARIGAVHSVVFGGFSAESLAGRLVDAQSSVVITADGVMRGAKPVQLKAITDKACEITAKEGFNVKRVVCVARLKDTPRASQAQHSWVEGRDVWYSDFVKTQPEECECEWMDSEAPLFMLYTSGSTGKPKGVLHTTGGYMLGSFATTKYTFDYHPEDVYFCTADCGWITGHSYVTYGPMLNTATQVVFEGVPTHPEVDRFWKVCEKYKVSIFYTAPTAIRALMKSGDAPVTRNDLSSLRLLGSVGEPINPEAWRWYHRVVGGGRCAIADTHLLLSASGVLLSVFWGLSSVWGGRVWVLHISPLSGTFETERKMFRSMVCVPRKDFGGVLTKPSVIRKLLLYWQTETGSHLITPLVGAMDCKPGSASFPFFGVEPAILDENGKELEGECSGRLVLKRPPPSMMRTVYGDHQRFEETYFSQFNGCYFTGDGCKRDKDGFYWLTGRMDDVINVSGHRIGTAEVESALVAHPKVAEAAVVGFPHEIKGEGIWCYDSLKADLKKQVREVIGAFAMPDEIHWAPGLPKTRSGKIMRRVLRKLALPDYETQDLGDTSTLADPSVVDVLKSYHPRKAAAGYIDGPAVAVRTVVAALRRKVGTKSLSARGPGVRPPNVRTGQPRAAMRTAVRASSSPCLRGVFEG